jgi:hypothetical protein
MKNFYKLIGIIALVAVIGFSFTACGGGGGGGGGGPAKSSGKGPPPDNMLSRVGLTKAEYNKVVAAVGRPPDSWQEGSLILEWGSSSKTHFDTVAANLNANAYFPIEPFLLEDGMWAYVGIYDNGTYIMIYANRQVSYLNIEGHGRETLNPPWPKDYLCIVYVSDTEY